MTAQLFPIDIVSPGTRGINYQQQSSLLHPQWATRADNAVIDSSGRLAARRGWSNLTTTPVTSTPNIETLFEYIQEDGTKEMILAWDGGISNSTDDPEGSDISGAVTDTSGTWWFQNFNDKVLGFQDGQKPIVRTSGNFATVSESGGTAPTSAGGVALCAYGRVWALDSDYQTIKYSALLDEAEWAGSIDMSNVWTNGTDQVTAIIAFNGRFIVFGRNHIVIWEDGSGDQLGVDPTALVVRDIIAGTGCESQWSIQFLGESDVVFVSKHGIQTLSRVIQEKSNPLEILTHMVQTEFLIDLSGTPDKTSIRSVINPNTGQYLVTFPIMGRTWCLHYNRPFRTEGENAELYPITVWDLAPTALVWRTATSYVLIGDAGVVGRYAGADTDNGVGFVFDYESPYFALDEQLANRLKILKRMGSILWTLTETSVNFKWDFDFKGNFTRKAKTFANSGSASYWGEALWGVGEFAGALALRIFKFPAAGSGQYIKIGLSATVTGQFAIQQLELFPKIGRLA